MRLAVRDDSDVGLADLIAAVGRLAARDAALVSRIAEMLHVEGQPHSEPAETKTIAIPERTTKPAAAPAPPKREPVRAEFLPSVITRARSDAPAFATPMPSLPPPTDEEREPPPPFEPLFQPSLARAMLGAALATPHPHGPADLRRMVDLVSRGQAIASLPRRRVPTLRRGVHVLVDYSSGMMPFRRDAAWLVDEISRVVGSETATVLRFHGVPSRGVADPRRKLRLAYEPPPPTVPVALITDFGIGFDDFASDHATTLEWIEFLRDVRRRSDVLLAFVPYPRRRCPRDITSLATVIEYDRGTTLTAIRSLVARHWRRG